MPTRERARVEILTLEKQAWEYSHSKSPVPSICWRRSRALPLQSRNFVSLTINSVASISKADSELESLEPQFAKANAQHEDVQRRGNAKQKEVQGDKDKLAQTVNRFKLIEDAINAYIENDGPGKIEACGRTIKLLKKELDRYEKETQQVTKKSTT
ncbi:hypothetical protein BKA64DRAFT_326669 [Cadophora sp. MPI-SDFR-AT-0126]|nr:hypothetical protein BKA64DRAFT_326669 [Leotiomycetes sp. MPI-SDFR-AT-0126]